MEEGTPPTTTTSPLLSETETKNNHPKITAPAATTATTIKPKNKTIATTYGYGSYHPTYLQCLANRKAFLVVFCLTCVLQGTFHTYFVAVITTLEKLFNIPSRTIGGLMMAGEIGQVSSSLFLPYYAGQGHRPRWMAFGSALFAVATLCCASPQLLLGDALTNHYTHSERIDFCSVSNVTDDCVTMETDFDERKYYLFAIIFMSLLSIGFGQTAIFTLGIPYLDDNVANRDSPVYFSITIGVRILGPVTGFVLGSLCTRLYIDPANPPTDFGPSDPRWLGAWWLGLLLISLLLLLTSLIMAAFPARLPHSTAPTTKQDRSLRNFPAALKRLLKNRILVLRTFSSVFHLLPISGLYTFLPKYLESQFKLAAFEANMVTGFAGILVMGVGIFGSGLFIRKKEPGGVWVAGWVMVCAGGYAGGMFILTGVGCGQGSDLVGGGGVRGGGGGGSGGGWSVGKPACPTPSCTSCPPTYAPVCGSDGVSYLSACHAGCTGVAAAAVAEQNHLLFNNVVGGGNLTVYSNCSCISPRETMDSLTATPGPCPSTGCPHFPIYLVVFMAIVLLHSTSEVGSMLLTLRCVEPRDKAMALGLIQCAIGLLGNVPCPLIYGSVVDQACVVWGGSSGGGSCHGNDDGGGHCWIYDGGRFRVYFHGLTGSLMTLAFLIDLIIVFKAREINFGDEKVVKEIENHEAEEAVAMETR